MYYSTVEKAKENKVENTQGFVRTAVFVAANVCLG
jgi:hypothetical protein